MLLAEKLRPFIEDKSRIQEMGASARKTVIDDFSMEKMVGELETIYSETLVKQ